MPGVREPRQLTMLVLPAALRAALLDHAMARPTREVCGLLGGRGQRAWTLYRVSNGAQNPRVEFAMPAGEQIAVFQAMRRRGERLVGIYHSHPNGPPRPSARDLEEAAYPGVAYLIVSMKRRSRPALRAFVFDGKAFRPLRIRSSATGVRPRNRCRASAAGATASSCQAGASTQASSSVSARCRHSTARSSH